MEEINKKKNTGAKKTETKKNTTKKANTSTKKKTDEPKKNAHKKKTSTSDMPAKKVKTTKKVETTKKVSNVKTKSPAKKQSKPVVKEEIEKKKVEEVIEDKIKDANKKEPKVKKSQQKVKMTPNEIAYAVITIAFIMIVLGILAFVCNTLIKKANYNAQNPVATMEVENFGTVKIELYPDIAPNTVANFIKLANNGFYDGLVFHRTIPDFMIQGGDKNGDGTGSATLKDLDENNSDEKYNIEGEFILNGYTKNKFKNKRGVIAMARSDYSSAGSSTLVKKGYNTASSQFFITVKDNNNLDGAYAAFGEVTEGMDVVDKIVNVEVETREASTSSQEENSENANLTQDKPINPPVIKSIRVETYGVDYGMPKTIEAFDYSSYLMQQYGSSSN